MTAKEYLSQYKLLSVRLEMIEANIKATREERLTLSSSWPDGQPHGTKVGDPTSQKAIELISLLEVYETEQRQLQSMLWSKRIEIIEAIGKVTDPDCYKLLTLRYIDMLTWEQIASRMGYSYPWVASHLHSKALCLIREIMEEK